MAGNIRKAIGRAGAALSLGALMLYGTYAVVAPAFRMAQHFPGRFSPAEQAEIEQWACVERVVGAIPDDASTRVGNTDAWPVGDVWWQRVVIAAYPRLDLSNQHPPAYELRRDIRSDDPVAGEMCGDHWFEAIRTDG